MQTFEEIAKGFSLKVLPESEVELSGEVPADILVPLTKDALAHIAEGVELPGFRKGHVPLEMVGKKVGEVAVLEEAVELAMQRLYPTLLTAHTIDAVGRPDIRITKLTPGNPAAITVRVAVYPVLELPKNWKEVGSKVSEEAVLPATDAEVDEAIESIRKARADVDAKHPAGVEADSDSAEVKAGAVSEAFPDQPAAEGATSAEAISEKLPALDDAFAQSLGQFTDVTDLKAKLRENMTGEKEQRAREARRGKIIDTLIEKISVAIPHIFVESELEKIMGQMRDDIARVGMQFEDYLKRLGKTEEDVRGEFRDQARKRALLQLTLNKIAEEENIEADQEAVEAEMKHALEHFPDARPDLVKVHIETVLRNEKVLQLLERGEEKE